MNIRDTSFLKLIFESSRIHISTPIGEKGDTQSLEEQKSRRIDVGRKAFTNGNKAASSA